MAGKPPPAGGRKYEDDKLAATYLVGKSGADMHEDELARKRGRKTIVIAAGVLLALCLVGTAVGLGVGLSKRNDDNKSSNKSKLVIGSNDTPASSGSASVADLKYLPAEDSPEAQNLRQNGSPEVKLMYQLADDAKTITPEKVIEFLDYINSVADLKGKGVDIDYFKDQAYSIAHWCRAKGYTTVLDLLRRFSQGEKLDAVALARAAEQLLGVLKDKGDFRSWMNWPGGSDDEPLPDEAMTRRKAEDRQLADEMEKANTNTVAPAAVADTPANRRARPGLLANPFLQYTNVMDPRGWMNNPASLGYPSFKPIVIPVVFHLLMFNDRQGYLGPRNAYSRGANPGRYLISLMNRAYKSTNIQFRLAEWRNDPKKRGWQYLNLGSVAAWQSCAARAEGCTCRLAAKYNRDARRFINIWVSGSDGYPGMGDSVDIAYSTLIPNVMDTCRDKLGWKTPNSVSRHLWFLWDQVDPDYQNNEAAYNDGAATIIHEVGHQLGLLHTHQGDCSNLDDIGDTPPNRVVQEASYYDTLTRVCIAAWRDPKRPITAKQVRGMTTCKGNKYIDNISNYMSYTHAACYRLFTQEQTKRMQRVVDGFYNRFRPRPRRKAAPKKAGRRLSA